MNTQVQVAELAARSLSRRDRDALIQKLTGGQTPTRIIGRREFAARAGRSIRWVDDLVRRGVIEKVRLPGSARAIGFRESEVEALLSGQPIREGRS